MSDPEVRMSEPQGFRPPRDNLVRAISPGVELRESDDGGMPTLTGHFARFGVWNEIDSIFEGRFMEQVAPGAYLKTISENRDRMKVTFNHGNDPQLGDKVLGPITDLREDSKGPRYEVQLLDTSYNRDLLPGLKAGVYGASYRFRVMREEINDEPGRSKHNPEGLPERTIKEAQVLEFGPVTFPADAGATAGVRSLTDEFVFGNISRGEGLRRFAEYVKEQDRNQHGGLTTDDIPTADKSEDTPQDEPSEPSAGDSHPEPETEPAQAVSEPSTGDEAPVPEEEHMAVDIDRFHSVEDLAHREEEIKSEVIKLNEHAGVRELTTEERTAWNDYGEELAAIQARLKEKRERDAFVERLASNGQTEPGDQPKEQTRDRRGLPKTPEDIYDIDGYRKNASTEEQRERLLLEGVKRSVESTDIPLKGVTLEEGRQKALDTVQRLDRHGRLSAYVLAVGSPTYRRAFGKFANAAPAMAMLSPGEAASVETAKDYAERAFTLSSTGLPVPYQLDPTIIPISNFSVNPFRAISRIVQTTVKTWKGATSAGITAAYATEGTEASDNTPTLAQPSIDAERAQAFVPFSIEVEQDWSEVEAEMGREVADAKDDLEATKFTLGTGTNEPQGIIVGASTTVATGTTGAFAIADLYKMEEALPPRFRPRASVIGNRFVYNKVRQFDTSGGSGVWLDGLQPGLANQVPTPGAIGPRVLGYPAFEDSAMDATLATGSEILVIGDFRYFIIVDRVGMSADLIPHLVGTNHRPTGQRGLYFFWRNGSKVVNAAAFRTLQT